MKNSHIWNIIQYNINKSNNKLQHGFLPKLDPIKHHVIVLQESWHNPLENTTVNHTVYHLILSTSTKFRSCVYVSKALAIEVWKKEDVPEESDGDITSISLQTIIGKTWVHNIYNPPLASHNSK